MTDPANQPADISTFWEQLSAFMSTSGGLPSREQLVEFTTSMGFFQAVLLVALGAVYLLYGWKVFKALVVVNATLGGAVLGSMLGARMEGQNMQIIASVTGGAMFGIVAWPMMKYAVAVMGGLAGSFIGYGLWVYAASLSGNPEPTSHAWAGALMGLVTLGMLTFLVFQETVVLFTAVQGALLAMVGGVALAMRIDAVRPELSQALVNNVHLVPVLIVVPALIGVVFQHSGSAKKAKAKKAKQPAVA